MSLLPAVTFCSQGQNAAPIPMLLTCSEMRAAEERAFADGVTAAELMEEAGVGIARAVRERHAQPGHCLVFFGKGHNGGDALVAARYLAQEGWSIELRPVFPEKTWTPLTRAQRARLGQTERAPRGNTLIVLDGLLGIGAGGNLREPIRSACRDINELRQSRNAQVFALDLPTGLDGDSGAADADAVVADVTVTIGFPKLGLVADGAANHVGRLAVVPLAALSLRATGAPQAEVATAQTLSSTLRRRPFDLHKGECGRVGILAGSPGMIGAALLCAEGALRGGAGLIHLYVPEAISALVAGRVAAEVMVHGVKTPAAILGDRLDVLAVGPGLGRLHGPEVRAVIAQAPQPMVIDADGLNLLAEEPPALERSAGLRVLTPHPGEMARLDPDSVRRTRKETVDAFLAESRHVLLLKGSRTLVGQRGHPLSYNSTGHPGMATGGVGDVTTGVIAALMAQGLEGYHAARLGAWVLGRAAEVALASGRESAESLRPTALVDHLGMAFEDLRRGVL